MLQDRQNQHNGEFDLIRDYFNWESTNSLNGSLRQDVKLAIGDDCAVTYSKSNQYLAMTTDTLVEDTHFLPSIDPADLAYKAVAVNLSDLAAMGAEPAWISLALTLPSVEHSWLSRFSESLFSILNQYNINLIGGDTTRGKLSLTLTAHGILTENKILYRHTAKVGDWIYVSGYLGDSAAGCQLLLEQNANSNIQNWNKDQKYLIERHLRPTPRVLIGRALAGIANAAIDLSDGLISDLGHILNRSQCGAVIALENLPLSAPLLRQLGKQQAEISAISGGEDYELCFTVSEENCSEVERVLDHLQQPYTKIGQIIQGSQLFFERKGQLVEFPNLQGFDHFKG
ncbi:thiamine-phosphate kinase [Mergibacter septicus]|uniref:thiamine-phosphate kinase n=1 Tax=Mergibacter septicus TaxID=221402 RepID=UPI00117945E9|nr:thiamine-phosphate kinase [Mergibacter septicus]AWX13371.1 thiamine-phosphate kinase [Mergibacter septicus]